MTLTLEQWHEILNVVRSNSNSNGNDILEQIKAELKKQDKGTFQTWEQRGFDVNHLFNIQRNQMNRELTLLHIAAFNGRLDIIRYFVDEKKVDINKADNDGEIALHFAAKSDKMTVVKFLLNKGADSSLKDQDGKTPRDLADSENMKQLIKEAENKQAIPKKNVSSISNVQPNNPHSTKGNKLPIITACTGLLLGLGIAYLAGAATLTPVGAVVAVFVAAAAVGALVGYGVGKVSQKLFVESIKEHPELNKLNV